MPQRIRLAALLALLAGPVPAAPPAPDVVLSGELTRADHQSYRMLPFAVPPGVDRLTVRFDYDRASRTTVDLGLRDPERFRGWSGGNKSSFFVSETAATPSYLPGPLPSGEWRLVLGVPNLREGVTARYRAEIFFLGGAEAFTEPFAEAPLVTATGWYRGELHAHSGHSDGSCASSRGARVPCPVHRTLEAAAARGLDFVALTEHNARSQHQSLVELQALHDDMVLLTGREITTFRGHFNALGTTAPIDFRDGARDMRALLERVVERGGLVSINHPALPSGEACMGCGWQVDDAWDHVSAVEVLNGAAVRGAGDAAARRGIAFWERLLDRGFEITAVAGSDNHDPAVAGAAGAIGVPATVIHARALSQPALLEGVRTGRVFIDVQGSADALLDLRVDAPAAGAVMGGTLRAAPGTPLRAQVTVRNAPEGVVRLIRNGRTLGGAERSGNGAEQLWTVDLDARPGGGWIRAEVADPTGRLLLLSNPVYLR